MRGYVGEILGTFLLVFFGCGALASALTTDAFAGIGQVALVWGLGIAVAIYVTGSLSGAHLNPAVTLGLWVAKRFPGSHIAGYVLSQCLGSFLACLVLYAIFTDSIVAFEVAQGITRGAPGSEKSAMIFTEFFANPTATAIVGKISVLTAMTAEILGTMVLMLVILAVTDERNAARPKEVTALVIGLTVSLLICLLGPITMACFNPARDLPPRIFAALFGWGSYVFKFNGLGWLIVYVLAPCVGATVGALAYSSILQKLYQPAERQRALKPLKKAA